MRSARTGPAALSLLASAALVSSGFVGGLLAGSGPAAASTARAGSSAPNVCGQPPAGASSAAIRAVPAGHAKVILDADLTTSPKTPKPTASSSAKATASATASAPAKATASASAKATPSASAKATPSPSAKSTPKATASASTTPKATKSATPTPKATKTATPTPKATKTATPTPKASPSPTGKASPTTSPTPTKSASPSPSPTATKNGVQLCLKVQPVATKSGVHPGGTASYAIWVWPAGGAASSVSVTISSQVAGKTVSPKFTVCPTASGLTCQAGGISKGGSDELQATVGVAKGTKAGQQAVLSATAKSSDATAPAPATGAVKITAEPAPAHSASPSPTPTPTPSTSVVPDTVGVGGTLPAGILPTVPGPADPATLPQLPNPESSPGGLFPKVPPAPTPSPSPYSAILPNARNVQVTDAAATFPFGTRLVGGEIIGLAVLAAALAIAIVRFSLRRPRPQHSRDSAD